MKGDKILLNRTSVVEALVKTIKSNLSDEYIAHLAQDILGVDCNHIPVFDTKGDWVSNVFEVSTNEYYTGAFEPALPKG